MRHRAVVVLLLFFITGFSLAEEAVNLQMITKIKQEGFKNSKVMETLSQLTDVHGPRLTGSKNLRNAQDWVVEQMKEWDIPSARVEDWGVFGYGWEVERYSAEVLAPQYINLIAHPQAWTPGTDSLVSGPVFLIDIDDEDFETEYKGKLSGAIILLGKPRAAEDHTEANEKRLTDEELTERAQSEDPAGRPRNMERIQRWRKMRAQYEKANKFLLEEGARVVLRSSQLDHGTLRVMSGGSFRTAASRSMPSMVVAMEHYNRIARLLEMGIPVEMAVNIQSRFLTEDSLGYNVIAEIPGTDRKLKEEVVMLGAHIDSWHGGTGATDNATGCAVMMEAMRILKSVNADLRRTVRMGLWSAEEQGLLGARGYVKKYLGNKETMELKPAHEKISAYYNLDNGGGKIRGIYLQDNDAARPFFEAMFKPFHDMGATTVSINRTGSTDHMAFDEVGIPGFQFIQDPMSYFSRTWHTNMDVYDHVSENDLIHSAVIVAAIVYHTANRDERIPRKPLPKGSKSDE